MAFGFLEDLFGGGDDATEKLIEEDRRLEQERQAKLQEGMRLIDALFADYYGLSENPEYLSWMPPEPPPPGAPVQIGDQLYDLAPNSTVPTVESFGTTLDPTELAWLLNNGFTPGNLGMQVMSPDNMPHIWTDELGNTYSIVPGEEATVRSVTDEFTNGIPVDSDVLNALLPFSDQYQRNVVTPNTTPFEVPENPYERFVEDENKKSLWDQAYENQVNALIPGAKQQIQDAQNELNFALARAGMTDSTLRNKRYARLAQDQEQMFAQGLNIAERQRDAVRQQVEDEKQAMIQLLNATADPAMVANAANSAVGALSSTPATTKLEPAFQNTLSGLAFANQPRYSFNPNTGQIDRTGSIFG
jgi:hypothetical protein